MSKVRLLWNQSPSFETSSRDEALLNEGISGLFKTTVVGGGLRRREGSCGSRK